MHNLQETERTKPRIEWKKSLVNFATALWVIATIIMGPVMLMKFAYRIATVQGNQHPVTDAACWGVWLGMLFMLILGGCVERKLR